MISEVKEIRRVWYIEVSKEYILIKKKCLIVLSYVNRFDKRRID